MSDLDWAGAYREWLGAREKHPDDDRAECRLQRRFGRATRTGGALDRPDAWSWVERALADDDRRYFIFCIFEMESAPAWLGEKMLEMGIAESNPSFNKFYVLPAVRSLGRQRVFERLLAVLQSGSDEERAGAANASYWAGGYADAKNSLECLAAMRAFREARLHEFVANPDVRVRQCLIPGLDLDPSAWPDQLRPLVAEAIRIACSHPDDYIRHRVEVQLGSESLFRPLPAARD